MVCLRNDDVLNYGTDWHISKANDSALMAPTLVFINSFSKNGFNKKASVDNWQYCRQWRPVEAKMYFPWPPLEPGLWLSMTCFLCAFFWVITRRLEFICRRFGTLCLFHLHRQVDEILLTSTCLFYMIWYIWYIC